MQRPGGSGLPEVVHITQMAQNIKDEEEDVVLGNRRVALKPHAARIRQWVDEGRGDDWIARELNTTPSSVQSFRSRNSIYAATLSVAGDSQSTPSCSTRTTLG